MEIFILAAGAIVAWEWARLCGGGEITPHGWLAVGAVLCALLAGALGHYGVAMAIAGLAALGLAGWLLFGGAPAALWLPSGVVYLAAAGLGQRPAPTG